MVVKEGGHRVRNSRVGPKHVVNHAAILRIPKRALHLPTAKTASEIQLKWDCGQNYDSGDTNQKLGNKDLTDEIEGGTRLTEFLRDSTVNTEDTTVDRGCQRKCVKVAVDRFPHSHALALAECSQALSQEASVLIMSLHHKGKRRQQTPSQLECKWTENASGSKMGRVRWSNSGGKRGMIKTNLVAIDLARLVVSTDCPPLCRVQNLHRPAKTICHPKGLMAHLKCVYFMSFQQSEEQA
jgi:hypothetical protein